MEVLNMVVEWIIKKRKEIKIKKLKKKGNRENKENCFFVLMAYQPVWVINTKSTLVGE